MAEITVSATILGLAIGSLILAANFQFGLQTGWVSMMSMPAALMGFSAFKALKLPFTPQQNVYLQSVAVAVGTGPLAFGLVGAVPAIEYLLKPSEGKVTLTTLQITVWSLGVCFLGIFTAKLLRKFMLEIEKLRFPSGSAAAALISVLHNKPVPEEALGPEASRSYSQCHVPEVRDPEEEEEDEDEGDQEEQSDLRSRESLLTHQRDEHCRSKANKRNITALWTSFVVSMVFTAVATGAPILRQIPIFGSAAAAAQWTFDPSPAYIGQGLIMGFETTLSMLWGVLLGWLVLAPMAHKRGWAPGDPSDWEKGGQGWLMWIALAVMMADTIVSLFLVLYRTVLHATTAANHSWNPSFAVDMEESETENEDYQDEQRPSESKTVYTLSAIGLVASSVLCIGVTKLLFRSAPLLELTVAVLLAPLLSLLAVRALGETDLNPVSSLAKFTQFIFGTMVRKHPHAALLNIVAGAITEAGAQQAGDLMQDFKTGMLLKASDMAQLLGMVVGTVWSALVSGLVYKMYAKVYTIPGPEFPVPTAFIWADAARLMTGAGLPPKAGEFALGFGLLFLVFAAVRAKTGNMYIPSGVAVGVGMYSVPNFTLARFLGGLISLYAAKRFANNHNALLRSHIAASGLILGEGIISVLALVVRFARKQ